MAVSGNVGEVQAAELRVLPYQFEPPSRSRNRQEANAIHILANDGYDRLGNSTWCECGNCAVMDKVEECNCCTESHEVMQKLTSRRAKKAAKPVFILGLASMGQKRMLIMGRIVMYGTFLSFLGGYLSYEWVCRVLDTREHYLNPAFLISPGQQTEPGFNAPVFRKTTVNPSNLFCFGLWKACDITGRCHKVGTKLQVEPFFVTLAMVLATCALIGYACAIILDVASRVSILLIIAVNRMVEFCMAVSAVIHFLAMLHFTGLVKNVAAKEHLVRDSTGWGFVLAALSLGLALQSVIIMAIFRIPPGKHKHRRFWKMPAELRPRPYLSSVLSSGIEAAKSKRGGRGDGTYGDSKRVPKTKEKKKDLVHIARPSRQAGDEMA